MKKLDKIKNEILERYPTLTEELLDLLYEYIINRFVAEFNGSFKEE